MDETECSETSSLGAGSVQSLHRVFQQAMDKLCNLCNISNVLMLCLCNFSTMLCIYPLTCPLTPLFRGNALWQQCKTLVLVIDVKRFWESGGNVFLIGLQNWIPSALSPSSLSASASPHRHCFHYQRHYWEAILRVWWQCVHICHSGTKTEWSEFSVLFYICSILNPLFSTSNVIVILRYILTTILANSVVVGESPE